jgi:hypothetical protein
VQLDALEQMKAALGTAERPGLELLAEELRAEQAEGNLRLENALAVAERDDLRGRLLALAEAVRA